MDIHYSNIKLLFDYLEICGKPVRMVAGKLGAVSASVMWAAGSGEKCTICIGRPFEHVQQFVCVGGAFHRCAVYDTAHTQLFSGKVMICRTRWPF